MANSTVTVRVGDWYMAEHLIKGCAAHYADVQYFAFERSHCDDEVSFEGGEVGTKWAENCINKCAFNEGSGA